MSRAGPWSCPGASGAAEKCETFCSIQAKAEGSTLLQVLFDQIPSMNVREWNLKERPKGEWGEEEEEEAEKKGAHVQGGLLQLRALC